MSPDADCACCMTAACLVRRLSAFSHARMRTVGTMRNLEILDYNIEHLGENAAVAIAQMLDADQPLLFYLWQPHALLAPDSKYKLERVQLPVYTPSGYFESKTDYPTEILDKLYVSLSPGADVARPGADL